MRQEIAAPDVAPTGGVFQNRLLTEQAKTFLEEADFLAHIPQQIPVNDAGICLGRVVEFLSMQ